MVREEGLESKDVTSAPAGSRLWTGQRCPRAGNTMEPRRGREVASSQTAAAATATATAATAMRRRKGRSTAPAPASSELCLGREPQCKHQSSNTAATTKAGRDIRALPTGWGRRGPGGGALLVGAASTRSCGIGRFRCGREGSPPGPSPCQEVRTGPPPAATHPRQHPPPCHLQTRFGAQG